jgi:hypothetical protein
MAHLSMSTVRPRRCRKRRCPQRARDRTAARRPCGPFCRCRRGAGRSTHCQAELALAEDQRGQPIP